MTYYSSQRGLHITNVLTRYAEHRPVGLLLQLLPPSICAAPTFLAPACQGHARSCACWCQAGREVPSGSSPRYVLPSWIYSQIGEGHQGKAAVCSKRLIILVLAALRASAQLAEASKAGTPVLFGHKHAPRPASGNQCDMHGTECQRRPGACSRSSAG